MKSLNLNLTSTLHARVMNVASACVVFLALMLGLGLSQTAMAATHQTQSIEQECAEANLVLRAALVLMTQYDTADEARSGLVALAETLSTQRPLMYRVFYAELLQALADNAEAILADPVSAYVQLKPQVDAACVATVKRII